MAVSFNKSGIVNASGISIGANLIKSSTIFKTSSCASGISSSITEEGYWQIVATSGNSNWTSSWWTVSSAPEDNFAEDDPFTISFTIRSSDANKTKPPTVYIKSGMGYYSMLGAVTENWSIVYYTGTWKKTNSVAFHLGWSGLVGTYQIKSWKLEKSSILTPWIPNENDYGYIPLNHGFVESGDKMSVYPNHIQTPEFIEY